MALATAAAQMTKKIRGVIDSIKNAPTRLKQLSEELEVLDTVLTEVSGITGSESHGAQSSTTIALRSCQKELTNLELSLHSIDAGKMLASLNGLRREYPCFSMRRRLVKRYKGSSGMKITCASR
jgi:hypothetical protein